MTVVFKATVILYEMNHQLVTEIFLDFSLDG